MLDPARHARASSLFLDALDAPPEARDAALEAEPDADVREAARRLLSAHSTADGPLDRALVDRGSIAPPEASGGEGRVGHRIGPWQLEGVLGQGGMGVVYRARRADGAFEREVALKLLHPGPDTAGLAARLRSEQRILARLEHPHIARLYDGGVTDDGDARGTPYLVMELVRGVPITDYADARDLSVRERVRLAVAVCEGVAYAHQRLVVHRDLKPSNILVASGEAGDEARGMGQGGTDSGPGARGEQEPPRPASHAPLPAAGPRVKLLDFGIAKLLGDDDGEVMTRTHLALTPAYAAPEQVLGGEVTTATDVYALGVLLYELLAGTRPYRLSGTTASEAERIVCHTVPPPPSAAAPEARRRALRGDLDTVVMKALEKEPERRYAGARTLAADLRRHLDGEPVEARPATAAYRAGRFVRRHRTAVAAAAFALGALVVGSGVALWQAMEASAARDRAEERFAIAQEAARAMLYDVHDAIAGLDGSTPAREVIVSRSLDYLDRLASGAGDDPALRLDLAGAYFRIANVQGNPTNDNLGRTDDAIASFRRGIDMLPPPEALPDSLASSALSTGARLHEKLGVTLAHALGPDSALADLDRALALHARARALDPGDADLVTYLATGHINRGDYSGHPYFPNVGQPDSAMAHYEQARRLLESIPASGETQFSLRMLGIVYEREGTLLRDRGDLAGAIAPSRRALALRTRIAERDDATAAARRDIGVSHEALGRIYLDAGRTPEAVQELRRAFRIYDAQARANPESEQAQETVAFGHLHLGRALGVAGRRAEARRHLGEAVRILQALQDGAPGNERRRALTQEARDALAAVP